MLLPQCSACLVHLTWMVCETGSRWPYSCYFVGCCFQDLFKSACNILVYFLSSLLSMRFGSDSMVHPYSSIDTAIAWKKSSFILSNWLGFHMSIALNAFTKRMLSSISMNWFTKFRDLPFREEIAPTLNTGTFIGIHML